MVRVSSSEEMRSILGELKKGTSNYIDTGYLYQRADTGNVFLVENEKGTVLLSDEGNYYGLYYFLQEEVAFSVPQCDKPVICELFFRKTEQNFSFLEESGFERYASFQRMARKSLQDQCGEMVRVSRESFDIIRREFDCYADSIPKDQVDFFDEHYEITMQENQGILVYDIKNRVSTLKYIYVPMNNRNKGNAGKMIEQYFMKTGALVNRYVLWVNEKNENAIRLYEKYGYQSDGMKKIVWKKDGGMACKQT